MSEPNRPDLPERDPALDAAWKAHSTELPPRRLDAAILAAAHREAHARPHAVGDDDQLDARGPSRAWWTLAAAATIGAIAFGVLQLAPPPTLEPAATTATDVPRAPQPDVPADRAQAPPSGEAREAQALRKEAPAASRADAAPESAQRSAAGPPPTAEAKTTERERRAPGRENAAPAKSPPSPPNAQSPPARQSPAERVPEAAVAPRPFPAAPPAVMAEPSAPPAATASPAPPVASPPPALARTKPEAPLDSAAESRDVRERAPTQAAKLSAAQSVPRTEQGVALGAAESATGARAPAAWVERIRVLHAERRYDEAARELSAFRRAHADADARLPTELRAWAATIKPEP